MENIVVENNENFLPEEYITEKSKRKIVMDIMRKKLSDIQYQTVILFYFNELSVEEIADIMECPPGTVKYRLSVSRAKIKEGVLEYEKDNRDKLYSFAPIPFLAGLLAMEAETAEIPEMWSGIAQRLNIMQSRMAIGATHTVEQVTAKGLAVEEAITDTMKGNRFMGKLGKILVSIFKNKIVVGIVGLLVVAALTVAVINVVDNDENNSDKTEVAQDSSAVNTEDETGALPDQDTDAGEYEGDGDPYFYSQNSWIGIHDYSTGQLASQPEVVICPTASETLTLPFTPEQIKAQVPSYNDYVLPQTLGSKLMSETTDEYQGSFRFFLPDGTENTKLLVYNLSDGDMTVEDCINNNYVVIQALGSEDEAFAEIFGMDLSTIEEPEGVDDAYSEAAMEFLTEQFGSPTYIYYNYAQYRGDDNVIEHFYANIFFIWEFKDYIICVDVDEDFKENENGEYVVNLKNFHCVIYSPSAWSVFRDGKFGYTEAFKTFVPGENQIDEISLEDFMPLDCEYPKIANES